MTLLDKTLSYLGLMRVAEHERFVQTAAHLRFAALQKGERGRSKAPFVETDWEAKFKKAVTDLADARCSLADERATFNQRLADAVQDYEADALAMRKKREDDRDRIQAKRDAAKGSGQ